MKYIRDEKICKSFTQLTEIKRSFIDMYNWTIKQTKLCNILSGFKTFL